VVVDGNVERVIARLHAIETPLPDAKPEIRARAAALSPNARPGDFAQAMMDLGATVCVPKRPACGVCPWVTACVGRAMGVAPDLPAKRPKAAKPTRRGAAFVALRADGAVLVETRPETGLLGGMSGPPCTDWTAEGPDDAEIARAAPLAAAWEAAPAEARHVFTHFALRLTVLTARVGMAAEPRRGRFEPAAAARKAAPTALRKALDLGLSALEAEG
jgi:A/G-specific adenine glycosylase